MIELVDSHAHMYLSDFDDDIGQVVDRAKEAGIRQIFMPNINSNSIDGMLNLEMQYGDYCVPMMGIHPCYVHDNYKSELEIAKSWLERRDFCAIGEIGIDLYWDKNYVDQQIEAFEMQINWAKDLKKPIVIHCRESLDLTIQIVTKNQDGNLRGIFHCFTGDLDQAKKVTDLNFLLGIGGVVSFKNSGLDTVLKDIPLQNIVLETDSPYLAPTPFRGKRNEPAFVRFIAEKLAEIQSGDLPAISSATTNNALQLFRHGTFNT